MEKIKIGVPRALYYYYFGNLYQKFFENLGCEVVVSPKTNQEILDLGMHYSVDEMCLSMKILLGHAAYLEGKCDYLVVPRIDNYGVDDQTCTNFLAVYDILHSTFSNKLLHYNIDLPKEEDEFLGFIKMGRMLGIDEMEAMQAYENALDFVSSHKRKQKIEVQKQLLSSHKKILLVSHPYNIYDEMVGVPILSYLKEMGMEVILSDHFDAEHTNVCSKSLSHDLYFKHSKETIGSIVCCKDKIDGIIFLSSFPCALDSIVYELAMRRVDKPYLHLVIDDMGIGAGVETRLESFIDILEQDAYVK